MSEPRPILKLPLAVAFIAALLLWPVVGVSRPMPADFLTTPELCVYAIIFFTACLSSWERVAMLFALNRQNLKKRLHILGWSAYFSLFLSSCLLCCRLKFCMIHWRAVSPALGTWSGPPLALLGAILILQAMHQSSADSQQKKRWFSRLNLGLLAILAGVSLAHWAWFPLLALPGVLVARSWYGRGRGSQAALEAVVGSV